MAAQGLVLIGLMGAGKTEVGHSLATRLGWSFVDLDEEIRRQAGCSIPEIFAREGEEGFRQRELAALQRLVDAYAPDHAPGPSTPIVLATGGGTACRDQAWPLLRRLGRIIWLQVSPEQAAQRLQAAAQVAARPLLAGAAGLTQTLARLLAARRVWYAQADEVVDTDGKTPVEVAAMVMERMAAAGITGIARAAAATDTAGDPIWVEAASSRYPVYIEPGLLERVGEKVREFAPVGRVVVITNPTVAALYGDRVRTSLRVAGLTPVWLEMPDGESYKRLSTLERLYEEAAAQGVERGWPVLALGGGVVGDTAGLFAATFLRGLPFIQIPTTLLAQVDASVGGKVAVDLAAGKNLVGAFYQPRQVLMDPAILASLPPRQVRAGWAEVVKTAALQGGSLAELLDRVTASLLARPGAGPLWQQLLRECVRFKAAVVAEDEREESGRRAILNLGHTVGHALERVTGYQVYTHGEAVSIGLEMALRLSQEWAGLPSSQAQRVRGWLAEAGLPAQPQGGKWPASWEEFQAALQGDKKVVAGQIRWVLLRRLGEPVHMTLPATQVRRALEAAGERWAAPTGAELPPPNAGVRG
ncbi:MAG: 3-dehydroquinate synthase [Limnochordaceae bacterium]|nr:3-dehydroquinate synthase [Limnochordaceae bacterium]